MNTLRPVPTRSLTALTFVAVAHLSAQTLSLETAPPVVVKTVPVAGVTEVNPGLTELRVTYSKAMQDESWSWSTWGEENFPQTTGKPYYESDGRTCVLPVKLEPGRFYATWLNSDKFRNFKDRGGRTAVPYLLTFTTAETATGAQLSPIPDVEDLPGELVFHGRYRHRSRGRDLETPSELWIKEAPDGSLNVLAQLPFTRSWELASGDPENRLTGYQIWREPSGDQAGYRIALKLTDGMARLTRRGIRQDSDDQELRVPAGAWFDPNTRPDAYCAANILLRAFDLGDGEEKEFHVYDWDNSGEGLVDYTIKVRHSGKERVEVPAGTFEANHIVLTQVTSADTWFKKRAGHVTEFWVLDNRVIVRVLRHREPYEMMLLDQPGPDESAARETAATLPAPPFNEDQQSVIAWTDRQFRSFFDERAFAGWAEEERVDLEKRSLDALNGPRTREYYQAINTLGALRSTNALPRLRELALERVDKNNRDRWMAVRVLGLLGDRQSIPDLIPLVYHGNPNTHWWAQITLVGLTGQNFGGDWESWGEWWNASGGRPPYRPEMIRWWEGQAETVEGLKETLAEGDRRFLESIR